MNKQQLPIGLRRFRSLAAKGAPRLRVVAKAVRSVLGSGVVRGARGCHRIVREFEPWGIVFTLIGLVVALITIVIDLEDRQSERVFRAWQIVREFESRNTALDGRFEVGAGGSSMREALELLNRQFDGFVCVSGVGWISEALTGNDRRECLIPLKERELLTGLRGSFAYLLGINLEGAHLSGANLTGAILVDADLSYADLSQAGLEGARLYLTDLTSADLTGADLTYADLSDADLSDADLRSANLTGANLSRATLTRARLVGADLSDADLSQAGLEGARLYFTDLTGADLTGADLSGTDIGRANLTGADIDQSQLNAACGDASPQNLPSSLIWSAPPCQ